MARVARLPKIAYNNFRMVRILSDSWFIFCIMCCNLLAACALRSVAVVHDWSSTRHNVFSWIHFDFMDGIKSSVGLPTLTASVLERAAAEAFVALFTRTVKL